MSKGSGSIRNTAITVATFVALSAHGVGTYFPPTYEPGFDEPESHSQLISEARTQYSGYLLDQVDPLVIKSFVAQHPIVSMFLEGIKPILGDVYEGETKKTLRYFNDPDGGESLLEVVLHTGLPIDDFFEEKDILLFEKIQQAGLVDALEYVVLSNS
ncbi:MAG: hypothetical protein WBB19_19905 [Desulforhopalus sp.]